MPVNRLSLIRVSKYLRDIPLLGFASVSIPSRRWPIPTSNGTKVMETKKTEPGDIDRAEVSSIFTPVNVKTVGPVATRKNMHLPRNFKNEENSQREAGFSRVELCFGTSCWLIVRFAG